MLFNSHEFIFLFLPVVLAGHWWIVRFRADWKAPFLLLASVAFYAFAGWGFLAYLAASVSVTYALALGVSRASGRMRKGLCALSLALSVGALAVAKYNGFFVENVNRLFQTDWRALNLIVPLGISFFTFSQVAFVVGVFRREPLRVGFWDYALYVLYFPKLLMGPITEPSAFYAQLRGRGKTDWRQLSSGLQLLAFGLFKKTFFADAFARVVSYGFGSASYELSSLDTAVVALSYTFEIYFDFSGYTDMAVGVSRMLGIELPPNFDSPYKALSIRDFWKRWHLSLTGFLTRYVYFPLGGSRCGTARTMANVMIVFLVSGIWHGASWTFVLWGALHGALMVRDRLMERFDEKVPRLVRWGVTFALTNLLWLLFRSSDLAQFKVMLGNLREFRFTLDPVLTYAVEYPCPLWLLLSLAFAVCVALPNTTRHAFRPGWRTVLLTVAALLVGVCSLGNASSFVYFNF